MKTVIMAWGSGSRLWPVSRTNFPKQFMDFLDGKSLIQLTVERFIEAMNTTEDTIHINTKDDYRSHVLNQLWDYKLWDLIIEPSNKGTLAALAFIVKYMEDKLKVDENEIILLSPADHLMSPVDKFAEYLEIAKDSAKKWSIVLFGIRPTKPETGYGYIKVKQTNKKTEAYEKNVYDVEEFREKPDLNTAKKYLLDGDYLWNSGMFMFSIKTIKEEFKLHVPEMYKAMNGSFIDFVSKFDSLEDDTIDYAIMEKTSKAKIIPMELNWSDVGSWDSIYENSNQDKQGNSIKWDVILKDTKNSLVWTEKESRLVTVNGLENMLVVDTQDALYITKKGNSQDIKKIVSDLKKVKRREVNEHVTTYRFWGSYTILEEWTNYKMKRLTVNPGETLSLQMHHHRSEHWVVVKGTAEIVCEPKNENIKSKLLTVNESIYIPNTYIHRLANPGKEVLEIIEVQVGTYLEEDDIVRFEDVYGRIK